MPPKKISGADKDVKKKKSVTRAKGPRGMSKPLTAGLVMTDLTKKNWKLGPVIGQGGFGYIYLGGVSSGASVTTDNATHVIKIEPHANGPLFVELAFYQRVAKAQMVSEWLKTERRTHVGVPLYVATGSFPQDEVKYRFMVMDRFGSDIEKILKNNDSKFPIKTVFSLGLRVIDALEYIHEKEYVHADIKSSNLMLGYKKAFQSKVYLMDYGLAYRYTANDVHVKYKEDPKRKHDGTIEYTSRDAHKGCAPSRRGDLEILGYCMVQWLCGSLPWEDNLLNKEYVMSKKLECMSDISSFMNECFKQDEKSKHLEDYLKLVSKLSYEEAPDYAKVRSLFTGAMNKCGVKDDGVSVCLPDGNTIAKKRAVTTERVSSPRKKKQMLSEPANNTKKPDIFLSNSDRDFLGLSNGEKHHLRSQVVSPGTDEMPSQRRRRRTPQKTVVTRRTTVKENIPDSSTATDLSITEQNKVNCGDKTTFKRLRKRNVSTRDFGQSP